MKKLLLVLCISGAAILGKNPCCGQVKITGVLPITSDDQLKLEITLISGKDETASIHGKIASCEDHSIAWQGEVVNERISRGQTEITKTIRNIRAQLWSPASPHLYDLELSCGGDTLHTRIGFRKFEMKDGRFYLNGKPIFLRGNAINPPRRGIPPALETSREFARDYIRFLRGMNVNIIRIPDNQNWMDVCDEEGMMVFAGRYGRPRNATSNQPPQDLMQAVELYKKKELGPFTPHPSTVIYVLANEMPFSNERGKAWQQFLSAAHKELIKWDDTRPYIGNAGYGLGRSAAIYDVHRYWGWYYNTFLTYLNLRDMNAWQNEGKVQAITFTECVGNYTGIDGRYNLCSRTKQPGSQKCWTGHLPNERQGEAALEYQAFMLKNATEMFRRFRTHNPRLAGIMPFTILFHNWDGIRNFAQMRPKPAAYQYGISYQPVLLSWESWQMNVRAGNVFSSVLHVVNDDDQGRDLTDARIVWALEDINRIPIVSDTVPLPKIPYYGTWSTPLRIAVPTDTPTGEYTLKGTILQSGKIVSVNTCDIFIAGETWSEPVQPTRPLKIFDPQGDFRTFLQENDIPFSETTSFDQLSKRDVMVLSEMCWSKLPPESTTKLLRFAERGGRVVCLRQSYEKTDLAWLPVKVIPTVLSANDSSYPPPVYTYRDGMNINPERTDHPIFKGIPRQRLMLWSDYTDFDESKPGFPAVYPVTHGFLLKEADLTQVEVIANYGRNLAGTALCEIETGKGSVILCGFDLTSRRGIDPVAEKLLSNLIGYATGEQKPEPYRFVNHEIVWGDFSSERGIVTGANNGLTINPLPIIPIDQQERLKIVVDDLGFQYAGSYGRWNTKPGVQYIPHGRRPFAPFDYTPGGSDKVENSDRAEGRGYFAVEIPSSCSRMLTTLENPTDGPIKIFLGINEHPETEYTLPPHSVQTVERPLSFPERKLKVTLRGDRRTVLLRTQFK